MIKFYDLDNQYSQITKDFLKKIDSLMRNGEFILGQEVSSFEEEFAKFCHTKYAIGLNSGTDALFLSLKCLGIEPGDEVIVPVFTFIATSFAVSYCGAKPVFVDIEENTFNIDTKKIESAITKNTKAIIPVHLFGLCANMPEILRLAGKYNLAVIEDAAQAHGAQIGTKMSGSMGDFGCFSFYPTKNLGAAGDAGIITTNSDKYYKRLLELRDCGRSKKRYLHKILGYNSRLDNIQAMILRLKLKYLNKWIQSRITNAKLYSEFLRYIKGLIIPMVPEDYRHVFHLYTIRVRKREKLIKAFNRLKIPKAVFYQLPLHLQEANRYLGYKFGDFPVAENISKEILSLPIHSNLKKEDIKKITDIIRDNI